MSIKQDIEHFDNAYHEHDISKLAVKSNISVKEYIEITEQQKVKTIIEKYDLFAEIEEIE
ncbi:MAG: hypothetical protein VX100_01070 [Pseudomonadota bacterium]|uniref:hypothetical protein n=1 Tax=Pseudoalteromonas spongiae TaxID=298657 RepID=UPI000C2D5E6B|nr:hypothetical protein [Pseudoalteromonas spongiae]MEC8324701.1 hypothetical protein [Pseudomonadota bacterium]TMO83255.1 hypothetical protein CWC15_16220 [Pseudoalteromonas spongiae]